MPNRDDTRWERWGAIGGFLFVIGMALLFFTTGDPPEDATSEQVVQFYEANEFATTWGAYIYVTVAGLGLLWFLGSLRSALRRAEAGTGRLSAIATAAGAGSIVLLFGGAAVFISTAFAVTDPFSANFQLDVSTHEMVSAAGFGLFIYHLVLAGALVGVASVVSIRTGVFPKWLGWVGLVLALALVVPIVSFFAYFVFWAWVIVIAIYLLAGRGVRPAAGAAAAPG